MSAQRKPSTRPIAVDLFAGAGGFSLGLEQAGFDIAAAVELDPIHAGIHELNFPETVVICGDVSKLTGSDIRRVAQLGARSIDLVAGGPPCQGFSLIGHRILEDPRNSLVFHFLRLVTELRPKAFVMENVPGMATGKHCQLLTNLIERFKANGYKVRLPWRTLNAKSHGVPQDRERLFLLGARFDVRLPDYPDGTTRPPSETRGAGSCSLPWADIPVCPSVADAIGDLPNVEDYARLLESDELAIHLSDGSTYARTLRAEVSDPSDYSYPRKWDSRILSGCSRANHTDLSKRRFSATRPGATEPVSRFYKLSLSGLCNTLRAGTASERGAFTAPRPIHPVHPRCISVREAARLHSYPDWFRFHRTIWHGFRQIGNSVPPLLGRSVGSKVIKALGLKPSTAPRTLRLGPKELASHNMREAAAHFGVSPSVIAQRRRVAAFGSDE